jgi:multidrug efflux pump subunit AcrB
VRFSELSALSVRHWRFVLLLVVATIAFGVIGVTRMARQEDPTLEVNEVVVYTAYPGAAPADVEQLVCKPLDEAIKGVEDVRTVISFALNSLAVIDVVMEDGADYAKVTDDVRTSVRAAQSELPKAAGAPYVETFNPRTSVATMLVVLSGDFPDRELAGAARTVKDALALLTDVARTEIAGEQEQELRVSVDPARSRALGVPAPLVARALAEAHVRVPGGTLPLGRTSALVSVEHELATVDAVRSTPVAMRGADIVRVGDVARVTRGSGDPVNRLHQDGANAIAVAVYAREHANLIALGDHVREALARMRAQLPRGVRVDVVHDQPASIEANLGSFVESLLEGAGLVALAVFAFMGLRASLVVVTALPLSMLFALGAMQWAGYDFDQISIIALIIALGMLVDDAVVVVDAAQRFLDRGLTRARAAVTGTAFVFWANNSSTMTAIASFLPLFLMAGISGQFIRAIPAVVSFALLGSLLTAQVVTPLIASWLLRPSRHAQAAADPDAAIDTSEDEAVHERQSEGLLLRALHPVYGRAIGAALAHPWIVIALSFASLALAALMVTRIGVQFFPKAEKPVIIVHVYTPTGTRYAVTDSVARHVEALIRARPEVQTVLASVGKGLPRVYYNVPQHKEDESYAMLLVRVKGTYRSPLVPAASVIDSLRAPMDALAGVEVRMEELAQGPLVGAPVAVRIQGEDLDVIARIAGQIKAEMEQIPGAVNIEDDLEEGLPELRVALDADRIARIGLTPLMVAGIIRGDVAGEVAARVREGDREVPIRVMHESSPSPDARSFAALSAAPLPGYVPGAEREARGPESAAAARVRSAAGEPTLPPLSSVIQTTYQHTRSQIVRRDLRRTGTVRADVRGTLASRVLAEAERRAAYIALPPGYTMEFGGENEERDRAFASFGRSALIAFLLIYGITLLQFNSLVQPFIIVATIPFAAFGAILGLFLTRSPFGFSSFLGLVALIGIVVNHKIYLIDRINYYRGRGAATHEAVVLAGHSRLRPVVLTALTAIFGVLPLTLTGSSLWTPFGAVLIAGLISSTLLTLVVMPVAYVLMVRERHA